MKVKRPVTISLSPNTQWDDVLLALRVLFNPSKWFEKKEVEMFEEEFANLFGDGYKALAVNSGRSAEYLILKALGVGRGSEVVIQPFTCVAVVNSILWLGARPVYSDISSNFNLDPQKISEKLSENTRAIIVQNTFGIPVDINLIKKTIQGKKITLIEDCAHALGGRYNGKLAGTLGDVSFFSFGRDKVISSVFGGMVLTKDEKIYKEVKKIRDNLGNPSVLWLIQQLLHPILFNLFVLPFYDFGFKKFTVGKILLFVFQKLRLLSFPVYDEEKLGKKPDIFPQKMSCALAVLARHQLEKLEKFNKRRREIANYYFENLKKGKFIFPINKKGCVWLRFPILLEEANDLIDFAKSEGVLLGNWYRGIISPVGNLEVVDYTLGMCPRAEQMAENVVNLPTYPLMGKQDIRKVVDVVNKWTSIK